jgi:CheY-like chemotaxis protein
MTEPVRQRVLLVDDEPRVLEGLTLHLRRRYDVLTASNGAMGLAMMHTQSAPAVVVSDMHMPGMDGATFLASVRRLYPMTVRILLTGQANVSSAIAAINEGQVFRFLTKPCPPTTLQLTVEAAVDQHLLLTSERVLLQQTLHGSVEALLEVLSLTNPVSFGWAQRVKRLVGELSDALHFDERWLVEIAAMFSQLGYVTLPADVAEKVYFGQELSADESAMVRRVPEVTDRLLAHIPRLHDIRAILARVARENGAVPTVADTPSEHVKTATQILSAASRYLQLEALGDSPAKVVAMMRARMGAHDSHVMDALRDLRCRDDAQVVIREVSLASLHVGMILADDIHLTHGPLLVARGYVVTDNFVERCRNIREGSVIEPIRVLLH